MLETLQQIHDKGFNGPRLLQQWHELMEPTGVRDHREAFFIEVVKRANLVSRFIFFWLSALSILADEIEGGNRPKESYERGEWRGTI